MRVLPKDRRNPNKRSRETIFVSHFDKSYVGIYGGKLTSYRATADKVVDRLIPVLGDATKMAESTSHVALSP
jgi:glycerol-3-phosphate dehydrogenase